MGARRNFSDKKTCGQPRYYICGLPAAPDMYAMLNSLKDVMTHYSNMNYPDLAKAWCELTDLISNINGTEEITKTEYTDAFKPCPFCGSDELVITGGFFVRCLDCDAQSGVQYSEAHAVKEWNVRTDKKGEKQ